jgi:hypothetical protein
MTLILFEKNSAGSATTIKKTTAYGEVSIGNSMTDIYGISDRRTSTLIAALKSVSKAFETGSQLLR